MKRIKRIIAIFLTAITFGGCTKPAPLTVGEALSETFVEQVKKDASCQDIVDALLNNEVIEFAPAQMEVEEGLLNGFDNNEIKGFSEGIMFGPMIGSIPFIGYVFTVDEDIDGFMKLLEDSCNPSWNICTSAEETVIKKEGNKVLFVMGPKSLKEGEYTESCFNK